MEDAAPGPLFLQRGLDWRPHFWTDDQPPTPAQMRRFLDDYLRVPEDAPVLVHCKAGWGRTGSAIACALVAKRGWSAQRALDHFWARVPPAREVMTANGQADFVRGFAATLRGRGLDLDA
jgi:protein-tyrosine phosphatase